MGSGCKHSACRRRQPHGRPRGQTPAEGLLSGAPAQNGQTMEHHALIVWSRHAFQHLA
ncbi:hypothetical protein J2809_002720 [Arthrobacter pascens]|nr:hypothetical protein [Arthrobacter pascens]